ncbi:MAG: enoyl-CoA hydratase/isomerase family protein [Thermodesulfobacteriota bacterium]
MSRIITKNRDQVGILCLSNRATNSIDWPLVKELSETLQQASTQYGGLLITGNDKFFSIGFDLPSLLKLNRSDLVEFYQLFERTTLDLFCLPIPTAAVISGHAIAGGSILSLACDFRYSAPGKKLLGLNEIKLGVPVPFLADLILRYVIGDRIARDMIYRGDFFKPEESLASGLIDKIFPQPELEEAAATEIAALAAFPRRAFSLIKANRVEAIRREYETNFRQKIAEFVNCWFDPSTQRLLHEASEKF